MVHACLCTPCCTPTALSIHACVNVSLIPIVEVLWVYQHLYCCCYLWLLSLVNACVHACVCVLSIYNTHRSHKHQHLATTPNVGHSGVLPLHCVCHHCYTCSYSSTHDMLLYAAICYFLCVFPTCVNQSGSVHTHHHFSSFSPLRFLPACFSTCLIHLLDPSTYDSVHDVCSLSHVV